jgi:hypothetical protein
MTKTITKTAPKAKGKGTPADQGIAAAKADDAARDAAKAKKAEKNGHLMAAKAAAAKAKGSAVPMLSALFPFAGGCPALTSDPKKEGIPEFLQTQNRPAVDAASAKVKAAMPPKPEAKPEPSADDKAREEIRAERSALAKAKKAGAKERKAAEASGATKAMPLTGKAALAAIKRADRKLRKEEAEAAAEVAEIEYRDARRAAAIKRADKAIAKAEKAEKAEKAAKAGPKLLTDALNGRRSIGEPAKREGTAPLPKQTDKETVAMVAKALKAKKAAEAKAEKAKGKAAKAAKAEKPAKAKKPTSAHAGERARYPWREAEEAAAKGKIMAAPDFSAETHTRFRPHMALIVEAAKAKDLKALRGLKWDGFLSSTPKAMERYRAICIAALSAK